MKSTNAISEAHISRRVLVCGVAAAVAGLGLARLVPGAYADTSAKAGEGETSGSGMQDANYGELALAGEAVRIVTTAPAFTTSILVAGAAEKIVALDNNSADNDWLQEKFPFFADLPAACSSSDLNLETILDLGPDLVALAPKYKDAAFGTFTELGIPCISAPVVGEGESLMDQTMNSALYYGNAIGGTSVERAQAYADYFKGVRADVAKALEGLADEDKPRVLVVQFADPLTVINGNQRSMCQEWISLAGGVNVAGDNVEDGMSGRIEVSMEQVLEWNPQIVVCSSADVADTIATDSAWANVQAVLDGRVVVMPSGLMSWGFNGPEVALMVQFAAKLLHPELFAELDLVAAMRDFYREMVGIELTDEDVTYMLRTSLELDDYLAQTFVA